MRDPLLGKVPSDLDILVPSSHFAKIVAYCKDIHANRQDHTTIKIVEFNYHVLKGKSTKDQQILRVKLEVNSLALETQSVELDIKEIDLDAKSLSGDLLRDRDSKDFRANSLQFDISKTTLLDSTAGSSNLSGLSDINLKILTPIKDICGVFHDRKRIIRAIRLAAQHNFTYSKDLEKYLEKNAAAILQNFKHINQLTQQYSKCLADIKSCPRIFKPLLKWHLIHDHPAGDTCSDTISKCLKIVNEACHCEADDKFNQVINRYSHLSTTMVVALCIFKSTYPGIDLHNLSDDKSKLVVF